MRDDVEAEDQQIKADEGWCLLVVNALYTTDASLNSADYVDQATSIDGSVCRSSRISLVGLWGLHYASCICDNTPYDQSVAGREISVPTKLR